MSQKNPQLSFGTSKETLGPLLSGPGDYSALAKIVFNKYDKDNGGSLGHTEIGMIMTDMYRSMNKGFMPQKADMEGFMKILDVGRDGKVDQRDMEMSINKRFGVTLDMQKQPSFSRTSSVLLKP